MHPAPSIIVFTTLSGLGYGLAAMLGLGLVPPGGWTAAAAHVLALGLIAAGLMSSTLHLGNPQRAWRAFSQWRTSWLSREGVLAVISFPVLALNAWTAVWDGVHVPVIGLAATLLCIATVYCTAMIYASLKSIDAWHTPLTPAGYLAFALAGGLLLTLSFRAMAGEPVGLTVAASIVSLAIAWGLKLAWWNRLGRMTPRSDAASATGLGAIGRVRLFEPPHMNGNYLTREMGFVVARKHARKLRLLAVGAGGVAAALLCVIAALGPGWLAVCASLCAVALYAGGVLAERWLFFAEARHAVMSYYGR